MGFPWRSLALLGLGIALIAGLVFVLSRTLEDEAARKGSPSVSIAFELTSFDKLDGWQDDTLEGVLETFLRSCSGLLENRTDTDYLAKPFGGGSYDLGGGSLLAGQRTDWLPLCLAAETIKENQGDSRLFWEDNFTPVRVFQEADEPAARGRNALTNQGLYTGYYEPELRGSLEKKGPDWVPLLPRPDDLVAVDLGAFRPEFKGKRLAGRVENGRLVPYEDRAAIEAGKLKPQPEPIVWVDDPVDAFFLQIQGSGRVVLDTGEVLRVGYAGQNGHPYVAIGRVLVERGAMPLEEVSMQSIRAWLTANPEEGRDVMAANTSYIFFQTLDVPDPALGPLGADGVNLSPGRSLAVDRTWHALGVPVWVSTHLPKPEVPEGAAQPSDEKGKPFQRLMVAQDTGGAIRGPVRGDIFFGPGEKAAALAGAMKGEGTLTLLLPNPLASALATKLAEEPGD